MLSTASWSESGGGWGSSRRFWNGEAGLAGTAAPQQEAEPLRLDPSPVIKLLAELTGVVMRRLCSAAGGTVQAPPLFFELGPVIC